MLGTSLRRCRKELYMTLAAHIHTNMGCAVATVVVATSSGQCVAHIDTTNSDTNATCNIRCDICGMLLVQVPPAQ